MPRLLGGAALWHLGAIYDLELRPNRLPRDSIADLHRRQLDVHRRRRWILMVGRVLGSRWHHPCDLGYILRTQIMEAVWVNDLRRLDRRLPRSLDALHRPPGLAGNILAAHLGAPVSRPCPRHQVLLATLDRLRLEPLPASLSAMHQFLVSALGLARFSGVAGRMRKPAAHQA